jgi:hypothetical protein
MCVSSWKKIEAARIASSEECIFSYRFAPNKAKGALFDRDINFGAFMNKSIALSKEHSFVVICDISEFYPRLGHHRLENALRQVDDSSDYPSKIMKFLANFSRTNSFVELPPKDRTCSGLRLRADELARGLIS